MSRQSLLIVDSAINCVLGVLLILFPEPLVDLLGVPHAENAFYPSMLGAVLVGIGIALWLARDGSRSGLGLGGAVVINLCGGLALAGWLLFGELSIPLRGHVTLWIIALLLVGLSSAELIARGENNELSG